MTTATAVGASEAGVAPPPLSDEERAYLAVHRRRLDFVVELVRRLPLPPGRPRLLDVGPHFLTELLRERTGARVDQLGFRNDRLSHLRPDETHHECDLSQASLTGRWPSVPSHDVVLACEVVEHLHVPPSALLAFARSSLGPGGFLILQTPNAVALKRRALMLLGRNPYELLRDTPDNPGHFREYTREELLAYASGAGLEVVRFAAAAYFDYAAKGGALGRWYGRLDALLPAALRDGMTFVLRRPPGRAP
jgi:hypothetical protein